MVEVSVVSKGEECIALPPGFRFHPTDGEIIAHYLSKKVMNSSFSARAISEVNLNECEPWDLPKKAKMGEKEWYFFCRRDRKYPTGMRTNRATEAGYWKATGKDKEIYKGKGFLVGMKKTLVFYRGRAPKGEKTNWVMHEFRLEGNFSSNHLPKTAQDEWVVSRVFHKNTGVKKSEISGPARMNSSRDDLLDCTSLPHLFDPPYLNTNRPASNFTDGQAASTVLKASDGRHFAYCSTGMDDHHLHQHDQKNNYSTTHHLGNPCHTPQSSIYRTQIPLFSSQYSGYLHQDTDINSVPNFPSSGFGDPRQPILKALAATENESGLNKQCKVEQFSSTQSMVSLSQDTGLSTDINTEISSVVSKHELGSIRSYEGQDVLSSASPAVELVEWLWNY